MKIDIEFPYAYIDLFNQSPITIAEWEEIE